MSYNDKDKKSLNQDTFVSELVAKRQRIKLDRDKWQKIWDDSEQRWQMISKSKEEKWQTNTGTIDTNIAVEGAFAEIIDVLFGGDTGRYFGTKKAGTNASSPILEELMRVRLDTQIQLKKKAQGQYGIRQLLIKGTTIAIVTWRTEGGFTLKYKPVVDPMSGQMLNYTTEKIWVPNLVDRPEIEFLPIEDVYIENGVRNFKDALKMYVETVPLFQVKQKYSLNINKLLETSNPHLSIEAQNQRRRNLDLQDVEPENTNDVELTHIYKWCKTKEIQQILSNNSSSQILTSADFGNLEQTTSVQNVDVAQESTDQTEPVPPSPQVPEQEELFYHIVLGNDKILLQVDECEYLIEQDPFILCTYIPVDGEIYGLGIPYEVKSSQDQLKDIRDMSLDNIKLRLYTPIKYKPLSSASKLTLKIKPMAAFPDYSGNDISFLEVPDATSSALAREQSLSYQLQEGSHVNKIITGSGQGLPNNTATGASILRNQSGKAFKIIVKWIGENLIVPILEKTYARDRQFTTPEEIGKLLGGNDPNKTQAVQMEWSQVSPDQIFEDYEFEWISSLDKVADELAAQQMKELFPLLVQFPWFNALEWVRDFCNRLGIPTENKFFSPEQMQGMLQPGLMGAGGAVPQPNGTTGGQTSTPTQGTQPQNNGRPQ